MKTAIVLSGGGALGDFEFGTLKILYECGIRPDILIGTSVGALNATMLTAGEGAIDELEQIWRSITRNEEVYELTSTHETLKRISDFLGGLGRNELSSNAINAAGLPIAIVGVQMAISVAGALKLLDVGLKIGGVDVLGALGLDGDPSDLFDGLLQQKSLFTLRPIRDNYLIPTLNRLKERILGSNIELRVVAVSLEYGDLVYFSQKGRMTGWGWHIDPDQERSGPVVKKTRAAREGISLVDAVLASATIPIIFGSVEIDGEHFTDGGLRDVSPVRALWDPIAELNVEPGSLHAYVIDGSVGGLWRFPYTAPFQSAGILAPTLNENLITRTLEIVVNEALMNDVELAREQLGEDHITVFEPRYFVHDPLTFDETLIAINIDYGYSRAADVLLENLNEPSSAEALVDLDMIFYAIAKRFDVEDGNVVAQVIDVIHLYYTDPSLFYPPGYPFGRPYHGSYRLLLEDEVRGWVSYVGKVVDQVRMRRNNGLPSRSQAWECIKRYDWPFARRNPIEVRVNCRISKELLFDRVTDGEIRMSRILFYNDSDSPVQLGPPSLSGDLSPLNTQLNPATGQQIPPNNSVHLEVIFTQTRGPGYSIQIGTISLNTDNASQPTIEIRVVVMNPAPAINYSPSGILFQDIAQGDAVTQVLIVANVGNEPLTTHSSIIGLNADRFVLLSGQDLSLPEQNNNGDIRIALLTDTIGNFQATLHLMTNDPTRPIVDVPLHGIIIAPPSPRIEIVPPQLNFGTVQIGTTAIIPLSVRNTGPGQLRVELGRLSGSDATLFSIHPAQAGAVRVPPDSTTSPPVRIADVIYQPSGAVAGQPHHATQEIISNDPNQPVALVGLIGYATAPLLTVIPSDIDFGTNTLSAGFTAYNWGSATLTITGVRLRSGIAFSLSDLTVPQVLPPGSGYPVQVNRIGAQPGVYQDAIDIFKDNENTPSASVPLRAEIQ